MQYENLIDRLIDLAFEEDINVHGVGSIAELYDGDPSHRPHGCISSSVSVAEIIRGKYLLNKIKK